MWFDDSFEFLKSGNKFKFSCTPFCFQWYSFHGRGVREQCTVSCTVAVPVDASVCNRSSSAGSIAVSGRALLLERPWRRSAAARRDHCGCPLGSIPGFIPWYFGLQTGSIPGSIPGSFPGPVFEPFRDPFRVHFGPARVPFRRPLLLLTVYSKSKWRFGRILSFC